METINRQLCEWKDPAFIAKELTRSFGEDGFIWLDGDGSQLGRWITIAVNPIDYVCCYGLPSQNNSENPFSKLRELKPGHWTGWLSYEAAAWLEPSNQWKKDSMPTLWMASHDPVFKFDLAKYKFWIEGKNIRLIKKMKEWIARLPNSAESNYYDKKISISKWKWHTNKIEFAEQVGRLKELITKGDIFQANLSACCTTQIPLEHSSLDIYLKLRAKCPSPFGGVIIGTGLAKGQEIISTSPERFLLLNKDGLIETRPIKGTRPRHPDLTIDSKLAADLISSTKDRAENIMIVDLLRNDLGKVCQIGSINVNQLVGLESYKQVHHLTSIISGKINNNKNWVDLLEACWPGGSISGAPKVRACERLCKLEPKARGPYCGSLLHLNWDNTFDSNILIRSFMRTNEQLRAHAGCGIVADSDPFNEADELGWKIMPLLKALE